jgi:hypothetical protein
MIERAHDLMPCTCPIWRVLESLGAAGRLFAASAPAAAVLALMFTSGLVTAQESDIARTPNNGGFGIQKSLEEQIGPGRGDIFTPGSSRYLIARDPFRAIARGRQIFQRKFSLSEGLGPRTDDGVGNIGEGEDDTLFDTGRVAGLADSCAGCHGRPRGSAGHGGNVFTRPDSRDAPHLFGLGLIEMLADEITTDLRRTRDAALDRAARSKRPVRVALESKGIDYGWLTVNPDGSIEASDVEGVDEDLRVKPSSPRAMHFRFGSSRLPPSMLRWDLRRRTPTCCGQANRNAWSRHQAWSSMGRRMRLIRHPCRLRRRMMTATASPTSSTRRWSIIWNSTCSTTLSRGATWLIPTVSRKEPRLWRRSVAPPVTSGV